MNTPMKVPSKEEYPEYRQQIEKVWRWYEAHLKEAEAEVAKQRSIPVKVYVVAFGDENNLKGIKVFATKSAAEEYRKSEGRCLFWVFVDECEVTR